MSSGLVLDASAAVSWALPGEFGEGPAHLDAAAAMHVPALWWFEVRNALLVAERRGRISAGQTGDFLSHLARLPVEVDHSPDSPTVLQLARARRLTVYDAAYLELALRLHLPLATFDGALAAAARAEGVGLA